MPSKKTKSVPANTSALEKGLNALGRRLSDSAPKKRGSIHLRFTDSDEECYLGGADSKFAVAQATNAEPPVVRIAGPSNLLKSIVDGKKEASRAFITGSIQVSGDLDYLEALLKDLGLLNCE